MKIIENTTEFNIGEETAVAIGKFDGFHRGHQKLLTNLRQQQEKGLKSVIFTFVPSPAAFFSRKTVRELSTLSEKRRIFEEAGVDYLIEYPFHQEVADMEPETYIKEVLVNRIHARCVVAGDDVSYGKHGAGDYRLLQKMSSEYRYRVLLIDKVLYEGREVSSTYVREEVEKGNMEQVTKLLGAPYHIGGEIIHGKKLGRTIGMPTVNLAPPKEKLLPPKGVYYSYVYLHSEKGNMPYDGLRLPSITNIGTKPTVDNRSVMGVETYIYNFDSDVYGNGMEVYLIKNKRPEIRFDGIESLKAQMSADIVEGRRFHNI
ncbi:MAG: bifunctional riboflavin kinase/FAD synthetase [Lachnospiraceae bacterium]|nr:bifunctional riboflavin kinase/FAD synthetase [Lachnospiraceae bacterium]